METGYNAKPSGESFFSGKKLNDLHYYLIILLTKKLDNVICMKSVRIRSYSGPYFPVFRLNIQSECGKIRIRITPNMDTFYAVIIIHIGTNDTTCKNKDDIDEELKSLKYLISRQHAGYIYFNTNYKSRQQQS